MLHKILQKILIISTVLSTLSCINNRETINHFVIKGINLIPMTEEKIVPDMSIYISEGIVKQIDHYENLNLPKGVTVIDGEGKYLTPGFSDMHVHIHYPNDLNLFIANGVTTVRNMWGTPAILEMKDNIKEKNIIGPEIFTTGPLIDGAGAYWDNSFILEDKKSVRDIITGMKSSGYDFIKVYDKLLPDVYNEILEVSNEIGIPVVGHVPKRVDMETALNSGQQSIEHFKGYDYLSKDQTANIEETISNSVWNCPTIVVHKTYALLKNKRKEIIPELKYIDPYTKKMWINRNTVNFKYRDDMKFLNVLYKKGALIVSGTDANNAFVISGFSLHEEFELLYESGLTPYEVLLTTTVNPAKMLGVYERAGTIEVGKDADLVLLDKNPLEDITNTKTISGVISKGEYISKKKIEDILNRVEESVLSDDYQDSYIFK